MSSDGSRVFFGSPDPLLAADVNGKPDVYEWENGHVYLISSGTSKEPSFYWDNSETGADVFFVTDEGLVPSDKDLQNDIYDARVPRPGDNPPPVQTPCSGEVCQGPPSVPQLLTPPASATFEGLGNIPPEPTRVAVIPPPTKCKKGTVLKKGKCIRKSTKKKPAKKKPKSNRAKAKKLARRHR
jgi:hypothetical protein